jgi:N-acyl-D-aspartate/D-glutamate deacylase
MTPLDLENRLSAIETAIAIVASREPDLLDLVIDVLQKNGRMCLRLTTRATPLLFSPS